MNLLTAGSATPASSRPFFGPMEADPISDLVLGLFGFVLAMILVRIVARATEGLSHTQNSTNAETCVGELDASYRRKLIQWLSSATLLLTFTVFCACTVWFSEISRIRSFADQLAGPLGVSLEFYLVAFVPTLVWHGADFIERGPLASKWLKFITSYALLFAVLFSLGLMMVLLATGWFTVERPCGGMFVLLMQSCVGMMPMIGLPSILVMLLLPVLCLLKFVVSLYTRLERRR